MLNGLMQDNKRMYSIDNGLASGQTLSSPRIAPRARHISKFP